MAKGRTLHVDEEQVLTEHRQFLVDLRSPEHLWDNSMEYRVLLPITRIKAAVDVRESVARILPGLAELLNPLPQSTLLQGNILTVVSELLQNIVHHSREKHGVASCIAEYEDQQLKVTFSVSDLGEGIPKSLDRLRNSYRHYWDDLFAVTLALKEKVSRFKDEGRGKGLAGVYSFVTSVEGELWLRSGKALFVHSRNEYEGFTLANRYLGVQATVVLRIPLQ